MRYPKAVQIVYKCSLCEKPLLQKEPRILVQKASVVSKAIWKCVKCKKMIK